MNKRKKKKKKKNVINVPYDRLVVSLIPFIYN